MPDEESKAISRKVDDGAALSHMPPVDVPIGAILNNAVDRGMDPEALEKIVSLYERVSDREAAKEFAQALAEFQSECPPIEMTSEAQIDTRSGAKYSYKYAKLDAIAQAIRPLLKTHGLSYSWDSSEANGLLVVKCTARHVNGHSVSASFSCSIDSGAKMSGAQKSGAALTYARRQSLIQVLGLTTCDPDTDAGALETISEHKAANIEAMIDEYGADRDKFLRYFEIEDVSQLPESRTAEAMSLLEAKRKASTK